MFVASVNMGSRFVCGLLKLYCSCESAYGAEIGTDGKCLLSKLVVSVKLAVKKMLKVTKVVCYSDSQIM